MAGKLIKRPLEAFDSDTRLKDRAENHLVHHPPHYTQGSVECIDAIESALGFEGFIAFLRGQVIKYQWRLLAKENPLQDAEKAQWYQAKLIEKLKQSNAGRPAQNGAERNGN